MVGQSPKPGESATVHGLATEYPQHSKDFASVYQGLASKARDAFDSRPIRAGDPIPITADVLNEDALAIRRDSADLSCTYRNSSE
jgi:hypothetical protein